MYSLKKYLSSIFKLYILNIFFMILIEFKNRVRHLDGIKVIHSKPFSIVSIFSPQDHRTIYTTYRKPFNS